MKTAHATRACGMERKKGFEPSTLAMARQYSTVELLPQKQDHHTILSCSCMRTCQPIMMGWHERHAWCTAAVHAAAVPLV